eukprot:282244_1
MLNEQDRVKTKYEYTDHNYYITNKLMKQCTCSVPLQISECPYINYISKSLQVFKTTNLTLELNNWDLFDLDYLSLCYNHIISVHSFCIQMKQRQGIQDYIRKRIGNCEMLRSCHVLKKHMFRKREDISKMYLKNSSTQDTNVILMGIMESCLISLHCYLLHDADMNT